MADKCDTCRGTGGESKYKEGSDGMFRWVWVPCKACSGRGTK